MVPVLVRAEPLAEPLALVVVPARARAEPLALVVLHARAEPLVLVPFTLVSAPAPHPFPFPFPLASPAIASLRYARNVQSGSMALNVFFASS